MVERVTTTSANNTAADVSYYQGGWSVGNSSTLPMMDYDQQSAAAQ